MTSQRILAWVFQSWVQPHPRVRKTLDQGLPNSMPNPSVYRLRHEGGDQG